MFGYNSKQRPYLQPATAHAAMVGQVTQTPAAAATSNANTSSGISGFFSRMFAVSAPTSQSPAIYLQPAPASAPASAEVVLCEPVEGVACQSTAGTITCHPVEGIGCQPVTMVPVSMMGPHAGT